MYTEKKRKQIDLCCRNFFMQVARACVPHSRKCYTTSCHLCNKGPVWPSSSGTCEVSSCCGNQQVHSKRHDTSWKQGRTQLRLSTLLLAAITSSDRSQSGAEVKQDCRIRITFLPSNLEMLCLPCQLYRLQVGNRGHHLLGARQHLEGTQQNAKAYSIPPVLLPGAEASL